MGSVLFGVGLAVLLSLRLSKGGSSKMKEKFMQMSLGKHFVRGRSGLVKQGYNGQLHGSFRERPHREKDSSTCLNTQKSSNFDMNVVVEFDGAATGGGELLQPSDKILYLGMRFRGASHGSVVLRGGPVG